MSAVPSHRMEAPPRLRLVESRRRPAVVFWITAVTIVCLLVGAVVTTQVLAAQSSFLGQELSRRVSTLRDQQGRLQLEVAELSAPGRLAQEARRLGLRLPTAERVKTVYLGEGR